jgi:hypothetical protein
MFSPSKIIAAALVLALIASPTEAAKPRCQPGSAQVRLRKEWRTLSATEKAAYFAGFDAVIRSGFYDELANTHQLHNNYIHGNPLFLPWHRAFTVELEIEMRKTAGPQFALPYWDWGFDSQAPEMAPIWGDNPDQFGRGNGCVTTGHFAGRRTVYPRRGACLSREFARSGGRRMDPVTSTDRLNAIISQSRSYDSFRRALEINPHGGVHVAIGGDMAVMTSPNDPIFFLHHAMVDKVWNDWQKMNGGRNKNQYGGSQTNYRSDLRFSGSHDATVQDVLYPYRDWTVADTFDTESICFKYVDLDADDVAVNDLPPPTVRPTQGGTQPAQPPQQPTQPTQPLPPRRDDDDDDRRRRDDDDDDDRGGRHHHSIGGKIKGFFKDLFDAGEIDPSQAPVGEGGKRPEPAPVDNKVKFDFNEKAPQQQVAPDDRSELIKLRPPVYIPDSWLAANGHDIKEAREHEKQANQTVASLNAVFGYVSPSALWNQGEKVAQLAKTEVKQFTATLTSVIVNVENSVDQAAKNAKQAVVDIHARVKLSLGFTHIQNVDKVKPQLIKIIGEEAYGSKTAAGNPFRVRHAATNSKRSKTTDDIPDKPKTVTLPPKAKEV